MRQSGQLFLAGRIPATVVPMEEAQRLHLLRLAHLRAITIHRTSRGLWCLSGAEHTDPVSAGEMIRLLEERTV